MHVSKSSLALITSWYPWSFDLQNMGSIIMHTVSWYRSFSRRRYRRNNVWWWWGPSGQRCQLVWWKFGGARHHGIRSSYPNREWEVLDGAREARVETWTETGNELNEIPTMAVKLSCIYNVSTHFLLLIGLQGKNCRHKRGNSAQEKGRKTSWWHNLCSQILVAITFQVAIPYCKSCHIAPEILIQVLAIKTFHDAYPRLSRRNWKMKQKWKTIVLLIGGKAAF